MPTTIFTESFETDGNGTRYTTSVPEFTDGSADFFTRTDGSDIASSYQVLNPDGGFYFAAQDIDGEGAASTQTLTFSGIDITGFTNLSFSALFAEDTAGDSAEDWDLSDNVIIQYQIDGGGFNNLLAFESVPDGDDFNAVPAQDTDFDGDGDGTELTDTFELFSSAIAGTGSTLDLQVTFTLDAGDEDIAIDNIQVTGDSPATPLISEIQPNPIGDDPGTQTLEISGAPGTSFSGVLVNIESDPGSSNPGDINNFEAVSGTFDANGLLTVTIDDIENPSFTLALLDSFTGDTSTDIDTDDDGVPDDLSTFGTVLDAIGVPDTAGDESLLYGTDLGGTDFTFTGDEPRLIFRDASTGDWYAVNDPDNGEVFDINGVDVTPAIFDTDPTAGTDTFGSINPTVTNAPTPMLSIEPDNAVQAEGDAGTTTFTFTVTRSGDTSGTTSVDFAVTGDADATDFGGTLPSGTVDFADGETSQTISIDVSGDTDIEPDETFTVTLSNPTGGATITTATADGTILDDDTAVVITPIYEIQGESQVSPFVLNGQSVVDFFDTLPADTLSITGDDVVTTGVVTAVDSNGFYLQDPTGDDNIATSDALFVFTSSAPGVSVGDSLEVAGTVAEFFPGDTDTRNLPTTQLTNVTITPIADLGTVTSTIIGSGGRVPPSENIDDDAFATYDPVNDGIDFFESLEGMLVTAQDLQAVSGTNGFGEIFAVVDQGASASGISDRGTLNISPDDFNPEKIQIDEDSGIFDFNFPDVNAGDTLGDVTGVVSYSFGNFEILPTVDFTSNIQSAGLQAESTTITGTANQLTIASYNVLNLDPNDSDGDTDIADGRFDAIADQIVNNLNSPDIIALQEVQDNSGSDDDGTTSADQTLQLLVDAIAAAGGPQYEFIDNTFITDGASGGQPGGNIRTAYLYNPASVDLVPGSVQTIDGQGSGEAFEGARLPLVATFDFNGEEVTVVDNHFSSKGGSAPILGIEQDFAARQEDVTVNGSLDERQAQSAAVQTFVSDTLATDPNANVVVLGDLNEFEFVSPVTGLESAGLTNLVNTIPEDERYSFIFQGNSQQLDHILVSDSLVNGAEIDIVHANTEFAETDSSASDHDPLIVGLDFSTATTTATQLTTTGWEKDGVVLGAWNGQVNTVLDAQDGVELAAGVSANTRGGNDTITGEVSSGTGVLLEGTLITAGGSDSIFGQVTVVGTGNNNIGIDNSGPLDTRGGSDSIEGQVIGNGIGIRNTDTILTGNGTDELTGAVTGVGFGIDNSGSINLGGSSDTITAIGDSGFTGFTGGGTINLGAGNDTIIGFGDQIVNGASGSGDTAIFGFDLDGNISLGSTGRRSIDITANGTTMSFNRVEEFVFTNGTFTIGDLIALV